MVTAEDLIVLLLLLVLLCGDAYDISYLGSRVVYTMVDRCVSFDLWCSLSLV